MVSRRLLFALAAMIAAAILPGLAAPARAQTPAQTWTQRLRGSWIAPGPVDGAVVLVDANKTCEIVVGDGEGSIVRQAAIFLAGDIEKISGRKPSIVNERHDDRPQIVLATGAKGGWESYTIRSDHRSIDCIGADARGTAFAAYTLTERLGVDPLYLWTGYQPAHHDPLIVRPIDFTANSPTFKYRGMFHDDEDILPRPFEDSGYPLRTGDVPTEWYAKYFETALRLRMNMVAPYTRVHRRYEMQKMASDWGLFYTSHHYDILLSNPYGIERYGLGKARGLDGPWDWINNREGMLRYWRGGVEENKDLNCIWPVGMRGTDDTGYKFPPGVTAAQQAQMFKDAIEQQVKMTKDLLGADKQPPIFHFTLYTEMLAKYQSGTLEVPRDVIIVWPDDNDGTMRGLPQKQDQWKHGVYYHLAYLGKPVKQNAHIVPPARIAEEFRKIVDSGATEYMLVNVSELREFVREARMISDICWDAKSALSGDDPAGRFVRWWCREYYGDAAAPDAVRASEAYDRAMSSYDKIYYGSDRVHEALTALAGSQPATQPHERREIPDRRQIAERLATLGAAITAARSADAKMPRPQRQFFFEHDELPLLFDLRPTQAAMELADTAREPLERADRAIVPLEQLETEILRAERPPFEHWYRQTWIRRGPKSANVHRPYEEVRQFLSTQGRSFEQYDPEPARRRAAGPSTSPGPKP
jgi:hypothetical protein